MTFGARSTGNEAFANDHSMNAFQNLERPLAITMWDFSWLERRWPGAGYEDWDRALDELVERGYDAIRMDAYPHLIAADPEGEWEILPPWNQQIWGSPARIRLRRILPSLVEFLGKCATRNLRVGLSTWFQNDVTEARRGIASPSAHAEIWRKTLEAIQRAGCLDTLLYVDFCNEWPFECWAPFFPQNKESWFSEASREWMRESVNLLRASFPGIPLTYSLSREIVSDEYKDRDFGFLDFLEPHQWMAGHSDFYERVGYKYDRFDSASYEALVRHGERLYRSDEPYWKGRLTAGLDALVAWSRAAERALITTEGWAVVDYKDWPGLDWGWVKELNAWAVETVAASGRWAAICTSNFCGPQFHGMWRDVAWHQRLTGIIHSAALPE